MFLLVIVVLYNVSNKISNVKAILRDGNEQFLPYIHIEDIELKCGIQHLAQK